MISFCALSAHSPVAASRQRAPGFTLLEVMLAASILALVGLAVADGLNRLAQFSVIARQEALVRQHLASQYAIIRGGPIQEGVTTTEITPDGFVFERTIKPMELENQDGVALTGIYKVHILAKWSSNGRPEQAEFETWVYQP